MNIPNFHDGSFDGIRIRPGKLVHLFCSTRARKSFTQVLRGLDSLWVSDIKAGIILFDLVVRSQEHLSTSDIAQLYGLTIDAAQVANLLTLKSEQKLQLEINAS